VSSSKDGPFGPDTPATGEATNTEVFYQRDIAPTILELLGIDYQSYKGVSPRASAFFLSVSSEAEVKITTGIERSVSLA
jgi:hypothetical protein